MRIVILRYGQLGDLVLLSSVFESLYKFHELILSTSFNFQSLYQHDPRLNKILVLQNSRPSDLIRHSRLIRKLHPDLVIDYQNKIKSRIIAKLSKTPYSVYDSLRKSRIKLIKNPRKSLSLPLAWKRYLNLLTRLEVKHIPHCPPKLYLDRCYDPLLSNITGDNWIGFHCQSQHRGKQLNENTVNEVIGELKKREYRIFSIGSEPEQNLCVDLNLAGQTNFTLLKQLLAKAICLVTSDSGPLHVAEAVNTPVVAIFGSTSPDFGFRPWLPKSRTIYLNLTCSPCSLHGQDKCSKNFSCINSINSEMILKEILFIAENRAIST
ncbi:MAG: hypothetical protein APR63_09580 [Desulfuromonas sp. SDB]|nr:MAG: hypothetical protein APR63_09580 [Desulfuromonas sp. SDB]